MRKSRDTTRETRYFTAKCRGFDTATERDLVFEYRALLRVSTDFRVSPLALLMRGTIIHLALTRLRTIHNDGFYDMFIYVYMFVE